jgi:hypothetical protein
MAVEQLPVSGTSVDSEVETLTYNAAGTIERRRCVQCRTTAAYLAIMVFNGQDIPDDPFERAVRYVSWGFDPERAFVHLSDVQELGRAALVSAPP